MNTPRIRKARPEDLLGLQTLATQLAQHIEEPSAILPAEELAEFFFSEKAKMHCAVAEVEGMLVGMISWSMFYDLSYAHRRAFIADLCMHREYRTQGIGTLLFQHVVAWAKQHSVAKIVWEVWRKNEMAKRFYAKVGGIPDAEGINYVLSLHTTQH